MTDPRTSLLIFFIKFQIHEQIKQFTCSPITSTAMTGLIPGSVCKEELIQNSGQTSTKHMPTKNIGQNQSWQRVIKVQWSLSKDMKRRLKDIMMPVNNI
jgi:hypothetical protein